MDTQYLYNQHAVLGSVKESHGNKDMSMTTFCPLISGVFKYLCDELIEGNLGRETKSVI